VEVFDKESKYDEKMIERYRLQKQEILYIVHK
jgi:hypothetical protein